MVSLQFEILNQPAHSMARVTMEPGDMLRVETGTVVACDPTISFEDGYVGGVTKAVSRFLAGKSARMMVATAATGRGQLFLAPPIAGDIVPLPLQEEAFVLPIGALLACEPQVNVHTRAPVRGLIAGDGSPWVRLSGSGMVLLGATGGVHPVTLAPGQIFGVGSGHLLAFTDTMLVTPERPAPRKGKQRGLLMNWVVFEGPGTVLIQTRCAAAEGSVLRVPTLKEP